jgi:hypothetical protein
MDHEYQLVRGAALAFLGMWLTAEEPAMSRGMRHLIAELNQQRDGAVMQIKPNKTILKGKVSRVDRAADGWGANVEFSVDNSAAAEGFSDFLQAQPGSVVTIFAAEPDAIEVGKDYTLTTSVRGGPKGERVVIESVDARKK